MPTYCVDDQPLIARSAKEAIDSTVARRARVGAELRDDRGRLIARLERIAVGGVWMAAWKLTAAWPDRHAPIDLDMRSRAPGARPADGPDEGSQTRVRCVRRAGTSRPKTIGPGKDHGS